MADPSGSIRRRSILATSSDGVPLSAIAGELQSLLADRFKLRVHRDTRDLPVYLPVPARRDDSLVRSSGSEARAGAGTVDVIVIDSAERPPAD